jgi:hypothetical protein
MDGIGSDVEGRWRRGREAGEELEGRSEPQFKELKWCGARSILCSKPSHPHALWSVLVLGMHRDQELNPVDHIQTFYLKK